LIIWQYLVCSLRGKHVWESAYAQPGFVKCNDCEVVAPCPGHQWEHCRCRLCWFSVPHSYGPQRYCDPRRCWTKATCSVCGDEISGGPWHKWGKIIHVDENGGDFGRYRKTCERCGEVDPWCVHEQGSDIVSKTERDYHPVSRDPSHVVWESTTCYHSCKWCGEPMNETGERETWHGDDEEHLRRS
jgi:hypothetical protein